MPPKIKKKWINILKQYANENHSEAITSHLSEWLSSKGQIRGLVQDVEKWEFVYGHTTLNVPYLVWSRKLSRVGPG